MEHQQEQHLLQDTYDFVVVGGGTSGLVVASRLSENKSWSILVLEAGENQIDNPMINIPAMWTAILGSSVDWGFLTTPQNNLGGRILRHPQGKALGGSSALNAELFIAPSKADIDAWEAFGNPGWNWGVLAPYYRKAHSVNLPSDQQYEHLGLQWSKTMKNQATGPIQVSFPVGTEDPLAKAWIDASKGLNLSLEMDPFSGISSGMYSCPSSIDPTTKKRSYAVPAYLDPVQNRDNLKIVTKATVHKILFEKESSSLPIASGVKVEINGTTKVIKAKNEVILAAGAFQSPKMLELSGVGNATLLKSFGIPIVVDNPNVGENLQDHLLTGFSMEAKPEVPTMDSLMRQEPEAVQTATDKYTNKLSGPLSYGCFASHGFMPINESLIPNGKKELKQLFSEYATQHGKDQAFTHVESIIQSDNQASACSIAFPAQVNLHDDTGERGGKNYVQMPKSGNFISLGAILCHPLSRGSVHIQSTDVQADPKIDPNYLSHPLDLEVFARHILSLQTLAKTPPLASLLKADGRRNHSSAFFESLDDTKSYIKRTTISNNHPSCTCPMLPRETGGVVDEKMHVYGTRKLRVVDSSIMPLVPQANIQSTVYAVAERAADLIFQEFL